MLGEAGLTLSTQILLIQGRLRYIADWDTELTDRLTSRAMPSDPPIVIRRDETGRRDIKHRLVRTDVPAGQSRRFDYAGCKQRASLLYHRHVIVTAAASPLTLTFVKSPAWDAIKSRGWTEFARGYEAKRRVEGPWSYREQAALLNEVRLAQAALKRAEQERRIALAELIVENDSAPRPYTHDGALLRVRRSVPRQRIDLDMAQGHEQLSRFMVYSERKAFTRLEFRPIGDEPEGDDQNENVRGIWKS